MFTNVPSVTLADNGTQVAAADITQSSTKNILHKFTLAVADADATLSQVDFVSAGTYAAADIDKFQLWYHTSDVFASAETFMSAYRLFLYSFISILFLSPFLNQSRIVHMKYLLSL